MACNNEKSRDCVKSDPITPSTKHADCAGQKFASASRVLVASWKIISTEGYEDVLLPFSSEET